MRLEPVILELEREENDILIIAHESVLRVLYGYLMACDATFIPSIEFPRNFILEVGKPKNIIPSGLKYAGYSHCIRKRGQDYSNPWYYF